jgi:hypothetical protein
MMIRPTAKPVDQHIVTQYTPTQEAPGWRTKKSFVCVIIPLGNVKHWHQ